jgi:hypothetical protein
VEEAMEALVGYGEVVVEEGLQVRLAGLLRHLVGSEDWEEESVFRLLEGFVVAI